MRLKKVFFIFLSFALLSHCGTIYIPQVLPKARGVGKTTGQESLKVDIIPVTEKTLSQANLDPYIRRVVDASDLTKPAQLVSVTQAISERLPIINEIGPYKLGIGDKIIISQPITMTIESDELLRDDEPSSGSVKGITTRELDVSDDGFVSILGIGRIQLAGLSQFQAEDLIYRKLVTNQVNPQFELNISEFNSQSIYLSAEGVFSTEESSGNEIPYTNIPVYLHQILSRSSIRPKKGEDSLVVLRRKDEIYRLSLKSTLDGTIKKIRMMPEDRIFVEPLPYRKERAIITGEVAQPKLIELSAFERRSLAEALYEGQGVLVTPTSDSSQIYILRQNNQKIKAYHLDASDPSRLTLAAKFELRPNDIIFVAPQFVTNYNRALVQIFSTYSVTDTVF